MTLLTAISIGFWLKQRWADMGRVLDVYERIGDLIHVYYSGASRNFNLSGNVSDNFLIAFVLLLCIYEGVFENPWIETKSGRGDSRDCRWHRLSACGAGTAAFVAVSFYFYAACIFKCQLHQIHFGSVSMQELWMRHFYIRGKQSVLDRISLSGAISLIVILLLGICAAAAVVRFVPLPDKARLSGWQSDIRALYTTHLNFFEDGGIFEEQDSGWSGKISGGDLKCQWTQL